MVFLTQKVLMIIAHSLRFVQRKEDIFGTFVCHLSLSSALDYLHIKTLLLHKKGSISYFNRNTS